MHFVTAEGQGTLLGVILDRFVVIERELDLNFLNLLVNICNELDGGSLKVS